MTPPRGMGGPGNGPGLAHGLDMPTWRPATPPSMNDATNSDDGSSSRPPPAHVLRGTPFHQARRRFQVIHVIPRRRFQIGVSVAAPFTYIPISGPLHVPGWVHGVLIVRVHAITELPKGSLLRVDVQRVEVSPDEPNLLFELGTVATAEVVDVGLSVTPFSGILPAWLRVRLTSRPDVESGTQDVAISIDLLGRFR